MKRFFGALLALLALSFALATSAMAAVVSLEFNDPITLSATQAPNTWYTDRYAPAGFAAAGGQLTQTISAVDSATNRPGAYSSSFYNTQGRKFDLPTGTTGVNVDLYVPDSWATTGFRMAGLWGTAFNVADAISFYPIIEYASDGNDPRFQAWNNGVWVDLGLPADVENDDFYNIGFALNGGNLEYLIDGVVVLSVNALGSIDIGNTMLQGYNNFGPNDRVSSYNIVWGRPAADIPEPGTLALATLALVPLVWRRRRTSKQATPA